MSEENKLTVELAAKEVANAHKFAGEICDFINSKGHGQGLVAMAVMFLHDSIRMQSDAHCYVMAEKIVKAYYEAAKLEKESEGKPQ